MCCAPSLGLGVTAVNGDGVCRAPSLALGRVIRRRRGLDPVVKDENGWLVQNQRFWTSHFVQNRDRSSSEVKSFLSLSVSRCVWCPVVSMSNLMEKEHRSTAKAMTKEFVCMVAEPGSATKCQFLVIF